MELGPQPSVLQLFLKQVRLHMLLQNFKSIKSRGAIQQQMMNKLVDILEQFVRELAAAQDMFQRQQAAPPRTRDWPPVAGGHCHAHTAACVCDHLQTMCL